MYCRFLSNSRLNLAKVVFTLSGFNAMSFFSDFVKNFKMCFFANMALLLQVPETAAATAVWKRASHRR